MRTQILIFIDVFIVILKFVPRYAISFVIIIITQQIILYNIHVHMYVVSLCLF